MHSATMLILLHHYRNAKPAIDESSHLNHGLCINTSYAADGAEIGSGALEFGTDSVVRVAKSPSWDQLQGLIVDVQVRFNGSEITTRRNIVEGDGNFVLYVAPGGDLRFDFFTHFVGQTNPAWKGVSSVSHTINEPVWLTVGRWYRLRASFDGLATAYLWIDGVLVAQRSGFRSGIRAPGDHGISIGNWTLDSRFPLLGTLDWIAIWKLDEDVVKKNFVERLETPTHEWSNFIACLAEQTGGEIWWVMYPPFEELLVEVSECISRMDESTRADFYHQAFLYQKIWEENKLGQQEFHSAVVGVYQLLRDYCGTNFSDHFSRMVNTFEEGIGDISWDCWEKSQLQIYDPTIQEGFAQFSEDDFS